MWKLFSWHRMKSYQKMKFAGFKEAMSFVPFKQAGHAFRPRPIKKKRCHSTFSGTYANCGGVETSQLLPVAWEAKSSPCLGHLYIAELQLRSGCLQPTGIWDIHEKRCGHEVCDWCSYKNVCGLARSKPKCPWGEGLATDHIDFNLKAKRKDEKK